MIRIALMMLCTCQIGILQSFYRAVLYNGTSASAEQRLLAMTLAGIVNRDSARLYLLNVYETWSYTQTDERWRDIYRARGNVQFDSIASIVTLVDCFRPLITAASDISIPRLAQLVQLIAADSVVGQDVEVVTREQFSVLMRKKAGILSVDKKPLPPNAFALDQNYPNPFNATTIIRFTVGTERARSASAGGHAEPLRLSVLDMLGREVAAVISGSLSAGRHEITFDASLLSSGVYFYRLESGSVVATKRMVLLKIDE